MKRAFIIVGSICVMLVLLMTACAQPAPSPAPTPTPKPTLTPTPTPAEVIKWRMASSATPTSRANWNYLWWVEEVDKRTGGRLKIEVFDSGSVATGPEMLEVVASRTVDAGNVYPPYFPSKLPLLNIPSLAAIAPSRVDVSYMTALEMGKHPVVERELYTWNLVIGMWHMTPPYEILARFPVRTVEDLKGKKIRALGGTGEALKLLGAAPSAVVPPEIFTSITTGIIDGSTGGGEIWFNYYKIDEACKNGYYSTISFGGTGEIIAINRDSWNELPADIKDILTNLQEEEDAAKANHQFRADPAETEKLWDNVWKPTLNIQRIDFPAAEQAKVNATVKPLWDKHAAEFSQANAEEVIQYFLLKKDEMLKKYPNGIK